jgi:hypothetical protein
MGTPVPVAFANIIREQTKANMGKFSLGSPTACIPWRSSSLTKECRLAVILEPVLNFG